MCENSKIKLGGGGRVGLGGGQGGCEWRSEAFVKIQNKKNFLEGGGGGGVGSGGLIGGGGCQGGWERRIEAFVKILKKKLGGGGRGWVGGGGGGVRVAVNGEVKLL